jgi:16S rRNA (adenine1518-N6/adenine1519-N6)-dimethyltransferase
MCEILREMLDAGDVKNVQVINGDILKMTNDQFSMTNESPSPNYKIVANIPYYLTSPLIRMFLEMKNRPEFMVLMVQKEVAQRICACPQRQQAVLRGGRASPPKMSLLAVSVQFYANPEIISYVSKNAFYPQPNVDSAIIKIVPRESAFRSAIICDKFFKLVKMGFSAKRKMLINNLKKLDVGCLALEDVFEKIGLNPKIRAENLSIDDWTNLFTMLTNKNLL